MEYFKTSHLFLLKIIIIIGYQGVSVPLIRQWLLEWIKHKNIFSYWNICVTPITRAACTKYSKVNSVVFMHITLKSRSGTKIHQEKEIIKQGVLECYGKLWPMRASETTGTMILQCFSGQHEIFCSLWQEAGLFPAGATFHLLFMYSTAGLHASLAIIHFKRHLMWLLCEAIQEVAVLWVTETTWFKTRILRLSITDNKYIGQRWHLLFRVTFLRKWKKWSIGTES